MSKTEKLIIALEEGETVSFKYGGVTWKVAPLPFGINKALRAKSAIAVSNRDKIADMVDVMLDAIRYGLKGWEGLTYASGKEVPCVKIKDSKGNEILSQACLEMIYKLSAFDELAQYCLNPNNIPDEYKDAVEFSEEKTFSGPEPLEEDKKK